MTSRPPTRLRAFLERLFGRPRQARREEDEGAIRVVAHVKPGETRVRRIGRDGSKRR